MPNFSYVAKSLSGEEIKGAREAQDKFDLARVLKKEGYILIQTSEGKKAGGFRLPSFFSRVPIAEKMLFARNLSVMVAAGVSLARAIEILSEQTPNRRFKEVLVDLANAIRRGENLSQAMDKHQNIFSGLFRAMVSAGEKTGKLEEALKLISHQLKRDYDLRRKVRGAMVYPIIILIAIIVIGILMLIYVVPTLVQTFEEMNVELPLSTKIIIALSSFLSTNYIFVSIAAVLLIAGLTAAHRSVAGKKFFDTIWLKMPVISGLVKKTNAARTARTLGSLISSGVEILEALTVTEDVLQNHYYKEVIRQAKKDIEKGNLISKIFIAHPELYPLLVGEMIAVGEETGKLSEMLSRLALFYESEVSSETKDLSAVIEPVLMIVIGIAVGFFAVSMITPLYNLAGAL
ncbi:type II secretion system F family protein [Candidatus Giovannonibacteria bacterium]|nr:type II secretion system F family protein [Candidatus Giovannonibacteria bacterium]